MIMMSLQMNDENEKSSTFVVNYIEAGDTNRTRGLPVIFP